MSLIELLQTYARNEPSSEKADRSVAFVCAFGWEIVRTQPDEERVAECEEDIFPTEPEVGLEDLAINPVWEEDTIYSEDE